MSILTSFPGQEGGNKGKRINIARIFDQEYTNMLAGMYKKVDVEHTVGDDEPTDELGYIGVNNYYRQKMVTKPISERDFLKIVVAGGHLKLQEISLMIHQIDKDRNGYVTRNELDDILKESFSELLEFNLFPYINRFCSISNKILIDYKQFKEWIRMSILEAENQPVVKDNKSLITDSKLKQMKSNEAT